MSSSWPQQQFRRIGSRDFARSAPADGVLLSLLSGGEAVGGGGAGSSMGSGCWGVGWGGWVGGWAVSDFVGLFWLGGWCWDGDSLVILLLELLEGGMCGRACILAVCRGACSLSTYRRSGALSIESCWLLAGQACARASNWSGVSCSARMVGSTPASGSPWARFGGRAARSCFLRFVKRVVRMDERRAGFCVMGFVCLWRRAMALETLGGGQKQPGGSVAIRLVLQRAEAMTEIGP